MKISMEWLRQYLPQAPSAEVCGEALMHAGLPVETIEQHGEDKVMDVEVTSNRSDCLSHIGIARELGAILNLPVKEPDYAHLAAELAPREAGIPVRIDAPDLCPQYIARIIRGVKIGPSPTWMQRRLEAIGLRPINNVVDVTNYVLHETGHPLHAFDLAKVHGPEIVVRRARAGESIISIDGHERKLATDMLVIADADRPVALAGVMGGKDSEVSAATTDILLESARFDPLIIRKTARALAMKSDSSYRFERGIDPLLTERASLRAAQLIIETAGGAITDYTDARASTFQYIPKTLALREKKIPQVLGTSFDSQQVLDVLTRLRLSPKKIGDVYEVSIPSDRLDINIEIDLVEEVARIVGYGKIPTREEISVRVQGADEKLRTLELIRETLVAAGYFEAITFSFVSDLLASDFMPTHAKGLPRATAKGSADSQLRPSLIPGLLESLRRNESVGNDNVKLFEIGSAFWIDKSGKIEERRRIGMTGSPDVREIRGAIEAVLARLDPDRAVTVISENVPGFAAGASGSINWGNQTIGHFGLASKAVSDKLALRDKTTVAEIDLEPLLKGARAVRQLKSLPKFPAMRRDLSLVIPEATAFDKISSIIHEQKLPNLETIDFVTTYRGKPLEKGQKSVTIQLVFRSESGTLTGETVDAAVAKVTSAAQEKLGATLRQ